MKNILSILMLLVMLIVGVGPTVGMHFCGKDLRSIEVLSKQDEKSCCPKSAGNENDKCIVIHKDCCEIHEVQIVTDSYQLQERSSNIAAFFSILQANWFTTNYISSLVEIDSTAIGREYFPPDGFDAKDVDILGFICILRIGFFESRQSRLLTKVLLQVCDGCVLYPYNLT